MEGTRNRYILKEAIQVTNLHRKARVKALRAQQQPGAGGKKGQPKRYGPEAAAALKTRWGASEQIRAKSLLRFLPESLKALERHRVISPGAGG